MIKILKKIPLIDKISIIYALLIYISGLGYIEYILSDGIIHPFNDYAQNAQIRELLIYQEILYIIFIVYFLQLPKLIKLKFFYLPPVHFLLMAVWLSLAIYLKNEEVSLRSTFYYGAVADKHADSLLFIWSYPVIYIIYLLKFKFFNKDNNTNVQKNMGVS